MTKTVTLRLKEELHKSLKVKMAQEGKTIQEYLIELIKKDMKDGIQWSKKVFEKNLKKGIDNNTFTRYTVKHERRCLVIGELKNISFKVSKEFYTDIKRHLLEIDMNLKDYIISLIKADMETGKTK